MNRTRMTEDFMVSAELKKWAAQACPGMDIDYHTQEFVDHWLGNGQMKANWNATWRNWMRRSFSGLFGPPKMLPVDRNIAAANVHDIALRRSARAHGIDPAGMSEAEINNAIWQVQQSRKASS